MKAIILAAGTGSRIRRLSKIKHKCLIKIGEKTLITRLVDTLREFDIKDILIITGYRSSQIKREIKKKAKYLYFPHYRYTNNLQTLPLWFTISSQTTNRGYAAPANAKNPATNQTPKKASGDGICAATTGGTIKIPIPSIEPATSAKLPNPPMTRGEVNPSGSASDVGESLKRPLSWNKRVHLGRSNDL